MSIGITTDASALLSFFRRVDGAVSSGMGDSNLLRGFENAQATYLGDQRDQFKQNSRGGGEWPDLAPSTKLKRFYEAGGRFQRTKGVSHADRLKQVASIPFPILYISGELYTSLYPGESGNIFQNSQDSVSAGTEIFHAHYHQQGGGRLPQRQILHEPSDRLLQAMTIPITAGFRAMIYAAAGLTAPTGALIAA